MIYFAGQTLPRRNLAAYATSNPAGKVITLGSGDKSFMVFGRGVSRIGVAAASLSAVAIHLHFSSIFCSSSSKKISGKNFI